jgi:branched-chain amino acid transport system ATP-binding protein
MPAENNRESMSSHAPMEAGPILELKSVTKSFGGFIAVNNVNLALERKPVYGIIGPNGAGKTTLFHLLSGFLAPTQGQMLFHGQDITHLPPEQVARRGLVRSFQITSIFSHLTVLDNIVLSIQRRQTGGTRLFAKSGWRNDHIGEANELLDEVGIPASLRESPANDLPYGLKRAVELGISLAARPEILLLDEPTAGMSLPDISRTTELIAKLSRERMVVVVEHNLGVIADLADEIIVLQQGSILTRGKYQDVKVDPRVIEAYLGKRH